MDQDYADAKLRVIEQSGYRYDNIQAELNRMSERELTTEYAQKLMDEAEAIRAEWRK